MPCRIRRASDFLSKSPHHRIAEAEGGIGPSPVSRPCKIPLGPSTPYSAASGRLGTVVVVVGACIPAPFAADAAVASEHFFNLRLAATCHPVGRNALLFLLGELVMLFHVRNGLLAG